MIPASFRLSTPRAIVILGVLFTTIAVTTAATANATVTIHDGLATVVARNATVAEVLAEWSRVGGTAIVNGEKMSTQHVTLELIDVPEKQALDTVLRSAAAYLAIERAAGPDASKYGRIVILATSTAPRDTSPAPAAQRPTFAPPPPPFVPPPAFAPPPPTFVPPPPGGVQRLVGPDGQPVQDDQDGAPPPNRRAAPPGFSMGDAPPDRQSPTTSTPAQRAPVGVPVPGMIVAPPQPQTPQPQQ